MSFEVGKTYNDSLGNNYTLLSIDKDIGTFKFNKIIKKFRIAQYCGVDAVIQYGKVLFKSEKIKPYIDPEFDLIAKSTNKIKINKDERYIDVFKKHKLNF